MADSLVAPPPIGTPFQDAGGRITAPWVSWLQSVARVLVVTNGTVGGALVAAYNLADLTNLITARANLGLGSAATRPASDFDLAGAAAAVLAASLQKSANLSDLASAPTARTNLGLGTAATQASSAFDAAGAATAAVAAIPNASAAQTGKLTSTDWSTFNAKQAPLGYTPLNPANNLSEVVTPATARTNLGLGTAATQASTAFDAAGAASTVQAASLQKSSNLSDVGTRATALANLVGSWVNWTPTITPGGSMTGTAAVNDAQYLTIGPITYFKLYFTVTLAGTASGTINVLLPLAAVGQNSGARYDVYPGSGLYLTGAALIFPPGSTMTLYGPNNANFALAANIFYVSGFYRTT